MISEPHENPFEPGFGCPPPFLGRRPKVEHEFDDVMRRLGRPESPKPRALFLYGPRGTGKTVHLLSLHDRLRERRHPSVLLALKSDRVATAEGMRQSLFRPRIEVIGDAMTAVGEEEMTADASGVSEWAWDQAQKVLMKTPLAQSSLIHDIKAMTAHEAQFRFGLGSLTLTLPPSPDRSASESLVDLGVPVLITLDEAHMVEPEALRLLFNAVQEAGRDRPTVLVLAGTPDLVECIKGCGATFSDRGQKMPIGCLDAAAARAVIREPLHTAGITADDKAIGTLAQAADHYPWFLQLYGHAAFECVGESGGMHLDMEACRRAIATAHPLRQRHYASLAADFIHADNHDLVRATALEFKRRNGVVRYLTLHQMLRGLYGDRAAAQGRLLRHVGFIVEGRKDGTWEPGIPSFMDYIIQATEPELETPAGPEATDAATKDDFKP